MTNQLPEYHITIDQDYEEIFRVPADLSDGMIPATLYEINRPMKARLDLVGGQRLNSMQGLEARQLTLTIFTPCPTGPTGLNVFPGMAKLLVEEKTFYSMTSIDLRGCRSLVDLHLRVPRLNKIEGLSELNLTHLSIWETAIQELADIVTHSLQELRIGEDQIRMLQSLNIPNLKKLVIVYDDYEDEIWADPILDQFMMRHSVVLTLEYCGQI